MRKHFITITIYNNNIHWWIHQTENNLHYEFVNECDLCIK